MKTLHDRITEAKFNIDIDILDYYDEDDNFEQFIESIEQGIYEQEIIYYSNAIEYLQKNDPSLNESLSIASEMGYKTENLNSELLATLLYQQNLQEQLSDIRIEIEEIFEEYEEELINEES